MTKAMREFLWLNRTLTDDANGWYFKGRFTTNIETAKRWFLKNKKRKKK